MQEPGHEHARRPPGARRRPRPAAAGAVAPGGAGTTPRPPGSGRSSAGPGAGGPAPRSPARALRRLPPGPATRTALAPEPEHRARGPAHRPRRPGPDRRAGCRWSTPGRRPRSPLHRRAPRRAGGRRPGRRAGRWPRCPGRGHAGPDPAGCVRPASGPPTTCSSRALERWSAAAARSGPAQPQHRPVGQRRRARAAASSSRRADPAHSPGISVAELASEVRAARRRAASSSAAVSSTSTTPPAPTSVQHRVGARGRRLGGGVRVTGAILTAGRGARRDRPTQSVDNRRPVDSAGDAPARSP